MANDPKCKRPESIPHGGLRQPFAVAVAAVLALGILWISWSTMASRRLQARVDAIRARHEPLYSEDFATEPVAKDQNAALCYQAAATALSPSVFPPSSSTLICRQSPPFPAAWRQMAEQAVAADAKALLLARQARGLHRADWSVTSLAGVGGLNSARALAHVLGDAALLAHEQGNDAEAIERLRDLQHMADTLDLNTGLLGHLVAAGIENLFEGDLEAITPDLRIAEDDSAAAPTTLPIAHVDRQILIALIADLLDEQGVRDRRRLAILAARGERFGWIHAFSTQAIVMRPLFDLEAVRFLDNSEYFVHAMEQPTWAAAKEVVSHRPLRTGAAQVASPWKRLVDSRPPRYSRPFSSQSNWGDNIVSMEFTTVAERRTAATELAIRLYKADHHAWPTSLQTLVPALLPAVPTDPFSPDNEPLGYVVLPATSPVASQRPLLYYRAADSGGVGSPPAEPNYRWSLPGTQWRDVSRWTPATMPATGASN